ncbi:MAG: bacteriohemerythrin [Pseudomonadota bacterium]
MTLDPVLLTGIEEIDAQHEVLFDCLARLEHSITQEERWSAVHFALVQLSDFARIHFAVEEALMRLHAYPSFAAHVAEHHGFTAKLHELKETSIRADISNEMIAFLREWLVHHIGGSDHAYVPHLRTAPLATS